MATEDVMIDIETLSTANDALVLSIGARKFSCAKQTFSPFLGDALFLVLSPIEQILAGRRIDRETQEWWGKQDPKAAEHWTNPDQSTYVRGALSELADFIVRGSGRRVWAKGPHFDIAILDSLYRAFDIKSPWAYNMIRDTRTFVDGRNPVRPVGACSTSTLPLHHPLRDCDDQINMLWEHGLE